VWGDQFSELHFKLWLQSSGCNIVVWLAAFVCLCMLGKAFHLGLMIFSNHKKADVAYKGGVVVILTEGTS
jgi:hypothetical protein